MVFTRDASVDKIGRGEGLPERASQSRGKSIRSSPREDTLREESLGFYSPKGMTQANLSTFDNVNRIQQSAHDST